MIWIHNCSEKVVSWHTFIVGASVVAVFLFLFVCMEDKCKVRVMFFLTDSAY